MDANCESLRLFITPRRQGHDRLDRHAHVFEFFRESTSGSEMACIKKMGEIVPRVSVDRRMDYASAVESDTRESQK